MDISKTDTAIGGDGEQKYKSMYFPPNSIASNGPIDESMRGLLGRFAKMQVEDRVRRGIPLIRLMADAQEAEYLDPTADAYQQYLMAVRKTTSLTPNTFNTVNKFTTVNHIHDKHSTVQYQGPATMTPSTGMGLSKTSSSAVFYPFTSAFYVPMPATKDNREPSEAGTGTSLEVFEKRCKKLGLRVSSTKDE
ncbi:hypothetical protein F4804DRAFT_350406 [Jackrogersella minutella]|nr:hypothetical protein F4804DRAFT_350406 [Jackrogersella minutella]